MASLSSDPGLVCERPRKTMPALVRGQVAVDRGRRHRHQQRRDLVADLQLTEAPQPGHRIG
jgi:hypothetical protein